MRFSNINKILGFFFFILCFNFTINAQTSTLVYLGNNGKLAYKADSLGNTIPDFSGVGYKNSDESIPTVPVVKTITAVTGDNLSNIKNAINEVAAMPIGANGFRGAILFKAGEYQISDAITINTSGIVLRGEGTSTHFIATKAAQHSLIIFSSSTGRSAVESTAKKITEAYVPIGANKVTVESGHNFVVGEWVFLRRAPLQSWIDLLKTAQWGWTASGYVVNYERKITKIEGNVIYLDSPVMDVIDSKYANGYIVKYTSGRVQNCGIEDMKLSSTYTSNEDENHGWTGVEFNNATDGWARNLDIYYFGYSAVWMKDPSRHITVDNCKMLDPKSITTGGRKYSFNIDGQRCLVQNCYTRGGRHDYVNGSQTAGPSVFYNSTATQQHADIGPHHRWSTGILFDNIVGNGAINVQNRTSSGSGHGWAGAQTMFWNCQSSKLICQDPPGDHRNWAIGCIGNVTNSGDWVTEPLGIVEQKGIKVLPTSLFITQLNERLVPTSIPVSPSNLTAATVSSSKINLTWIDNSDNEQVFRIERSTNAGSTWSSLNTVSMNNTSYSDTGLTASTEYHYRVRAENSLGNSDYTNTINATTVAALPISAPTNLVATAVSVSKIDLTWVDNSNNEENFKVERSLDGITSWITLSNTSINSNAYSDTGLTDSTKYYYRVSARNPFGNSDYSNIADATTLHVEAGGNLALNRPVAFSSQQMEGGTGDNPAMNAVDGNTTTRWSSGRNAEWPQWIEVDLGSVKTIDKTEVVCFNDRAYQFKVEIRKDTTDTFTQVVDRTSNTIPGAEASPIIDVFTSINARYVRITVTGAAGYAGPWTSINEFRIFNSSGIVGIKETDNTVPSTFEFFHNYPNPFNPTTVISYQLSARGKVQLKVYDMLGREVAVLVDQEQHPGLYRVNFNGRMTTGNALVSTGVYLARINSGQYTKTIKMIFLK